jgi:hypothetical protein
MKRYFAINLHVFATNHNTLKQNHRIIASEGKPVALNTIQGTKELAVWKAILRNVLGQKSFAALEQIVLDELSLRN